MDSNYAYAHYTQTINTTDVNARGEMVMFVTPCLEGHTDLMSIEQYKRLTADFPDRIKGGVIKQDNLMNMVNYLYNDLKQEIEQMPEIDDSTMTKIRDLRNEFETDSFLIPDSNSQYAIDDLANKYFHLQTRVRDCQAKCLTTSKSK